MQLTPVAIAEASDGTKTQDLAIRSQGKATATYAIAPFLEAKFARMEYAGGERFHLAYLRHTDQWFEVWRDLSLDECLAAISDNPIFHP